jgi:hypothetical protein
MESMRLAKKKDGDENYQVECEKRGVYLVEI